MRTGCPLTALVTVMIVTVPLASSAGPQQHSARAGAGVARTEQQERLVAIGRVKEIQTPHLFVLAQSDDGVELLVMTSTPLTPEESGATVLVSGSLRLLDTAELDHIEGSAAVDEQTRNRARDGAVLVATSVTIGVPGQPLMPGATVRRPRVRAAVPERSTIVTLRPAMLADNIDELAGHNVRVVHARVVGVLEPHAFLIESATRYEEVLGQRDRIVVLIDGAKLRVPAEDLVASTVHVIGLARTVLGAQVSAEVPWPTRLDRDLARRLEIRAAVVATSVRTADGTELTDKHLVRR